MTSAPRSARCMATPPGPSSALSMMRTPARSPAGETVVFIAAGLARDARARHTRPVAGGSIPPDGRSKWGRRALASCPLDRLSPRRMLRTPYRPPHHANRMSHEGDVVGARAAYYERPPTNLRYLLQTRYSWMN